jgi:hypothetical protein
MDAFGRWQLEWMHLGGGNKKACFGEVALNMDAFGKWQWEWIHWELAMILHLIYSIDWCRNENDDIVWGVAIRKNALRGGNEKGCLERLQYEKGCYGRWAMRIRCTWMLKWERMVCKWQLERILWEVAMRKDSLRCGNEKGCIGKLVMRKDVFCKWQCNMEGGGEKVE